MSGSTISGTVTVGVTLGSGAYQSPLTILSSGYIDPTQSQAVGLGSYSKGSILNDGTILGGLNGGTGAIINNSSFENNGYIGPGYGGISGVGVQLGQSSTFINNGTVAGGGGEGNALINRDATFVNYGLLESNNTSGLAVLLFGGTVTNNGTIESGAQSDVLVSEGNFINNGAISNQTGGTKAAIYVDATGTFTNLSTVSGVAGLSGGIVFDAGYIGEVEHGSSTYAINFGSGVSQLIVSPGASFGGSVIAAGDQKHHTIEFFAGTTSGTLTGLGHQITGFGDIVIDPNAAWTIEGNTTGLAVGQVISGFTPNDTIVLDNFLSATDSFVTGTGLELTSGSSTVSLDLTGTFTTASFTVTDSGSNTTIALANAAPCFAAGTRILTTRGEIAVESLRHGDVAILHDQTIAPITWIGHRSIDLARHNKPETVQPILIEAGALATGVPHRHLLVSPDHAIFLSGHLIPAKTLINGHSIRQLAHRSVTYYHVELAHHAILLAEGCPAESYLETGNRGAFTNGETTLILHPDFAQTKRETQGCAPFIEFGPIVETVRATILNRAAIATTTEPNLTIIYQGGSAILASQSAIPGHITPDPRDRRRLGIKVARLSIEGVSIPLDHPDLVEGWHAKEADGRWTNGHAIIPASLLAGSLSVDVDIAATTTYPLMARAGAQYAS